MSVSFDDLEAAFVEAVKAHPAFVGWKKKGRRIFWRQVDQLHHGVELLRCKGSFEKVQLVGVCAFVSYVHPEKPLGYVPSETWKDGRMFMRAYIVPERQMVDEPTFASGAVIAVRIPEDVKRWASTLSTDFSQVLVPWVQRAAGIRQSVQP